VSGFTGGFLIKERPAGAEWYKGPLLIELIDTLPEAKPNLDGSFRMSLADAYKGTGSSIVLSGKLNSGTVR
jgi:translation elongation factor EF-1alpha